VTCCPGLQPAFHDLYCDPDDRRGCRSILAGIEEWMGRGRLVHGPSEKAQKLPMECARVRVAKLETGVGLVLDGGLGQDFQEEEAILVLPRSPRVSWARWQLQQLPSLRHHWGFLPPSRCNWPECIHIGRRVHPMPNLGQKHRRHPEGCPLGKTTLLRSARCNRIELYT
jgi:hypothetical protein